MMQKSLLASLCVLLSALPVSGLTIDEVWINEFHYDNSGSDTGEFVEIAAVTGTDLLGLTLVRVETASNGTVSFNDTHDLSGLSLANPFQGVSFASVAISGIQNGPNDGLALLFGNTVLQFISYEGILSTDFGFLPAPIDSTDIGVFEPTNTPTGSSLQFLGQGGNGTWTSPSANSRDSVNAGQSFTFAPTNDNKPQGSVPDSGPSAALLAGVVLLAGIAKRRIA